MGVEFKGGSRHDRNRHNRRKRQNRHSRLLALYFVGQTKGGQGALQDRQNRQSCQKRHELSGPISRDIAVLSLRYPVLRDAFKRGLHSPKMVRYLPLALSFTQAHLCDAPFCNVSRENCVIPLKNKHERVLRYYRYKYRAI